MNTKNTPLAYRPDIDGLRAFAVLAVVVYHAFPATLKGGFIGVDVFFVISGYLISGIILNDLQQGTFSLWNFYSRRIRRIFPALIVVLAAVLIFGWFALFPDEYRALGKHVLGGAAFISNFLLWREAGYFDVVGKAKPLLHLWSLGIEEQFYIIFPLLLWCCAKKHFRIVTVVIILWFCATKACHASKRRPREGGGPVFSASANCRKLPWIPASAGMTDRSSRRSRLLSLTLISETLGQEQNAPGSVALLLARKSLF